MPAADNPRGILFPVCSVVVIAGGASLLDSSPIGLDRRKDFLPASQALSRPVLLPLIILGDGGYSRWKNDPRLFGLREDMDVRWKNIGIVQCADANELNRRSRASIVAP